MGVFSGTPTVDYFQGTHRVEVIDTKEFLLYGTAPVDLSQAVASQVYAFKKTRFMIVGFPSRTYDGVSTAPDDDVTGLRGMVTDFEPRKFSSTTKDPNDQTTQIASETKKLVGTRVREVVYYKAVPLDSPDLHGIHGPHNSLSKDYHTEEQINPETQGTPVAVCVGYTDEFHTVVVKKGARYKTIKDEDKGNKLGNFFFWNHQYKFPAELTSLGIQDTDYEVTFEAFTTDGGPLVDVYGTEILEEIAAINKTSTGFQIQFRLNSDAEPGPTSYGEEGVPTFGLGVAVHQDVLLRIKISEAYAQPIILPTFGFDGLFGFHRGQTKETYFHGFEKNIVWKGESLLAASDLFDSPQAGFLNQFVDDHVGIDLPLWQKELVASRYVSFGNETPGRRPHGLDYDIVTTITDQPTGDALKGSSPVAEGEPSDSGNFSISRKSRNGFEISTDLLPEPHPSALFATTSNGSATVKVEVKERSVVVFHKLMPFGEQLVTVLDYLDSASATAGNLSWERRSPNSIVVKNATGGTTIDEFLVRIHKLELPSDTYAAGAGDGTFGGNRRQGNGILGHLSNMRTQLAKIADPLVPTYAIDPDAKPEDLPKIGPKHSVRQLAVRLQRIKTILLNNGLIEIDGNSSATESTRIMQEETLHYHKRGAMGNAPLADPQASQGKAGEVIFEAQTILPATKTSKTVQFPQHIKIRCDRGELTLDPSKYVVILTVYGQAGNELQFEENENPFVIQNKKEKSFQLKSSSSFTTDTTIVYEVCLPQSGDNFLDVPRYNPVRAEWDFEYEGGLEDTIFIKNTFKGLLNNAEHLSDRFDHMRNVLRNGQNIPMQWCTIDWKYDSIDAYQFDTTSNGTPIYAPFTMEVKKWGSGDKGFQYAPQIMYEVKTQGPIGKASEPQSIEDDKDTSALAQVAFIGGVAKQYIRSHTFRIRFFLGEAGGSQSKSSETNYLHYDPGATVKALRPNFLAEAESAPIFDTEEMANIADVSEAISGSENFLSDVRPRGFIRGLLITEMSPQTPFFYDPEGWPPQVPYANEKAGCYWGEDRFGTTTMPDGSSQYFIDYRIWNLRRMTLTGKLIIKQSKTNTLWHVKSPLHIVAIGRPDGNKRFQDGSADKPAGNLLYD